MIFADNCTILKEISTRHDDALTSCMALAKRFTEDTAMVECDNSIDKTYLLPPSTLRYDLRGEQFGLLTVIAYSHKTSQGGSAWHCRCMCGRMVVRNGRSLQGGLATTCPVCRTERRRALCGRFGSQSSNFKHGHASNNGNSRTYRSWQEMISRCYNPKKKGYHNYGGRGIVVCEIWRASFLNFLEDMGERPKGMSIDRIDNNGPYCPSNCRWTTSIEQANNMRKNHRISFNGKTQTIAQWAREYNIPVSILHGRITYDWPMENALTQPISRTEIANLRSRDAKGRFLPVTSRTTYPVVGE